MILLRLPLCADWLVSEYELTYLGYLYGAYGMIPSLSSLIVRDMRINYDIENYKTHQKNWNNECNTKMFEIG